MSHAHYIAIGLYTNSPNFFPKPLSNQFCQTLLPPNIPTIWYVVQCMMMVCFCRRWSSMVSEEHKYGYPDLHQLVASAYWKGKRHTIGHFMFEGYKFVKFNFTNDCSCLHITHFPMLTTHNKGSWLRKVVLWLDSNFMSAMMFWNPVVVSYSSLAFLK